jgi:hypothetical protein
VEKHYGQATKLKVCLDLEHEAENEADILQPVVEKLRVTQSRLALAAWLAVSKMRISRR